MPDSLQVESTTLNRTNMTFSASEVSYIVFRPEVAVEEEHGNGAEEGEECDDRADP